MPTTRQDSDFADTMIEHVNVSNKSLDAAIRWIGDELEPDDVFPEKKLERWAESNGYTKE